MRTFSLALAGGAVFLVQSLSATDFREVSLHKNITELEPLKGIILWRTTPENTLNAYQSSIALEYSYCLPCEVVTGKIGDKIQYNWSAFEALLNDIASRGHQAVIRFRYEYPGESGKITGVASCTQNVAGATAVPLYIKNGDYGYEETYSENPNNDGNTYYADWRNTELQWFTKQFYADFAAKYDNDSRIAFFQVGFGHWSEYHIYGTPLNLGVNFPSKAYQKEFLQHIASLFSETPWSISKDVASSDYTSMLADPDLLKLNFGIFDDSFMHENHDGYNTWCWNALGENRWKTAPGGGEISYYEYPYDQWNFLNPTGMYGRTWEEEIARLHISYMVANDAVNGSIATPNRVKEASLAAGYKFEIVKYQVSDTEARISVKNKGVAPLYHNAYITVKGVRSAASLKGLLPNETKEYSVIGLQIAGNEIPELTITSDKLPAGKIIPYCADLQGTTTSIFQAETLSFITQTENKLSFAGEKYTVNIVNLQGKILLSTKEKSVDLTKIPAGCYFVS